MNNLQERYIDGFCAMLQSDGLRCTSIRQNILRLFFLNRHLSVDDIVKQLNHIFHDNATKPSIYSTLKLLQSYKIITKEVGERKVSYEFTRHEEHFHLVCTKCNESQDFNDDELQTSVKELAQRNSFKTQDVNIVIYGICKECILITSKN